MGANSKIEWTHHTFNPWWGCVKVSPGCEHCYAETFSKRTGHHIWGPAATTQRRLFGPKHWAEPLKWNREAEAAGERRRVFCASMADVFEDHPQVIEAREKLFRLIDRTPALDWLLLTKRPENIERLWPFGWYDDQFTWPNIWIGTSVENQQQADERIPELLQVPTAVRFLSCEPLLGAVDISHWLEERYGCGGEAANASCEECWWQLNTIHWVIVGGESGPKARPMHPDWARSLRDQCTAAGVAFHFKQWGEWLPTYPDTPKPEANVKCHEWNGGVCGWKVGKKSAGRLLDGREWNEYPEAQHA